MELLNEMQIVDLKNAGIGNDGVKMPSLPMTVNTSVTNINLFFNEIGAKGAAVLADVLKKNTSLTFIDGDRSRRE
jgi:hypothetical protein